MLNSGCRRSFPPESWCVDSEVNVSEGAAPKGAGGSLRHISVWFDPVTRPDSQSESGPIVGHASACAAPPDGCNVTTITVVRPESLEYQESRTRFSDIFYYVSIALYYRPPARQSSGVAVLPLSGLSTKSTRMRSSLPTRHLVRHGPRCTVSANYPAKSVRSS